MDALARKACVYVNSSITLYDSSFAKKTSTQVAHLQDEAYYQLQLGLQPAALAAGDNGQWQALMTTISESSRVPEGVLVSRAPPTVRRCRHARSNASLPVYAGDLNVKCRWGVLVGTALVSASVLSACTPVKTQGVPPSTQNRAVTIDAAWGTTSSAPCDSIQPVACPLPFPDDYYTIPDTKTSTGRRVDLPASALTKSRVRPADQPGALGCKRRLQPRLCDSRRCPSPRSRSQRYCVAFRHWSLSRSRCSRRASRCQDRETLALLGGTCARVTWNG